MNTFLIAIIIILLLIIFKTYLNKYEYASDSAAVTLSSGAANSPSVTVAQPAPKPPVIKDTRSFYQMTDGEKVDFIINYYGLNDEERADQAAAESSGGGLTTAQTQYVQSLPVSNTGCIDNWTDCPTWAENNECQVNPEWMLYECANSCSACSLSNQDKYNLIQVYNSKPPAQCTYRAGSTGTGYPDRLKYLQDLEKYYDVVAIPI
jgi:hypothetical protein